MHDNKIFKLLSVSLLMIGCEQNVKTQLMVFPINEGTSNLSETLVTFLSSDSKGKRMARKGDYYNYTPGELEGICSIYGIDESLIDVLEYNGLIYTDILISTLPTFNQIAYYKTKEKEILYYCTISGSTWVNARVGAFDFKAKRGMMVDFDFNQTNLMTNFYLAFESPLSNDGELKLQIYQVDMDKDKGTHSKGQLLFDNILQFGLTDYKNN